MRPLVIAAYLFDLCTYLRNNGKQNEQQKVECLPSKTSTYIDIQMAAYCTSPTDVSTTLLGVLDTTQHVSCTYVPVPITSCFFDGHASNLYVLFFKSSTDPKGNKRIAVKLNFIQRPRDDGV